MHNKKENIDCLFIGHNEMSFTQYEKTLRKMGVNSGAYRDLNLNFLRYNNSPYSAAEILNLFCRDGNGSTSNPLSTPLRMGETFSSAIAYLGTYLDRRGFTFDYINSFQEEKQELSKKLTQENILLIAIITTLYVSVFPVLEIMNFIKKYNPQVRIVIGGPFISNQVRIQDPEGLAHLFKLINADFYVNSSQGEAALVELLHALKNNTPPDRVNNIYYKINTPGGNEYAAAAVKRENNRLSENMVNWALFADRVEEHVGIRTSISCPFSCAFCGFPRHAGKYQTAEVDKIKAELDGLAQIKSITGVNFIDDTFNVPAKRFKEILRMMIKNKYQFQWNSHLRCQFADKEMVELMKESGCEGVFLGIESGNDEILKNMNKVASVDKYFKGISLLKEYEILTFGSFIIGFPGETPETVRDTFRFIEKSDLDFYRAQLWYCDTITPIWEQKEKYRIKGSQFEWSHHTMSAQQACALIDRAFLDIEKPLWVPQYNFEFEAIFHLLHRGLTLEQVKRFISAFNSGIKEKLRNPTREEISFDVLKKLKASCRKSGEPDKALEQVNNKDKLIENYGADFDF